MMKKKMNGKRGGVFHGKYVRELISGRKGAVEFGSRVCIGAGRFVMVIYRQALQRFDLVELK